ncbi:MAG: AbrB/MazE/SpoVT family DNA-binding domain-containing protein [Candidatus Methylomirabilales bacterium]
MPVVKVSHNFQVVIPREIRDQIPLKKGDLLQIEVKGGKIILTPAAAVPAEEAWYWSKAWQRKVKRAQEDLKGGKATRYKSVAELRKDLGD